MTLYNHYQTAFELIIQTFANFKELPPDLPELIHEGPLLKKGQHHKAWKERWFVLFSNDQMLYYLNQEESNKATNLCGWIDLADVCMINAWSSLPVITELIPKFMKPSNINKLIKKKRKNSSKDKQEHELHLVTSNRTFELKCNNGDSFLKWILYLDKLIFNEKCNILYQGWVYKRSERKKRQWKKRWFIIEDTKKSISYFEDDTRTQFRHVIPLQDIVDDINVVEEHKRYTLYIYCIQTIYL